MGIQSSAYLIVGPQGSGKSTMVNVMIRWLEKCVSDSDVAWQRFGSGYSAPAAQPFETQIKEAREKLTNSKVESYSIVVLDDVTADTLCEATKLYLEFSADRIVFLFIVSSDIGHIGSATQDARIELNKYNTTYLTVQHAISFAAHRTRLFRAEGCRELLSNHPLFPFSHAEIESSVAGSALEPALALRQLNLALYKAIKFGLAELPAEFDIATIDAHEIDRYILKLEEPYGRLVHSAES